MPLVFVVLFLVSIFFLGSCFSCDSNIVFVWEDSHALSKVDFNQLQQFTNQVASELANGKTRFSLIHHNGAKGKLADYGYIDLTSDVASFRSDVSSIKLRHGHTNVFLSQALKAVSELFHRHEKDLALDTQVVILIGDGRSEIPKKIQQLLKYKNQQFIDKIFTHGDVSFAQKIQMEVIRSWIVAIGVGVDINEEHLRSISDVYISSVGMSYESLHHLIKKVIQSTCLPEYTFKRGPLCDNKDVNVDLRIPDFDSKLKRGMHPVCLFHGGKGTTPYIVSIGPKRLRCIIPYKVWHYAEKGVFGISISFDNGRRSIIAKDVSYKRGNCQDQYYGGGGLGSGGGGLGGLGGGGGGLGDGSGGLGGGGGISNLNVQGSIISGGIVSGLGIVAGLICLLVFLVSGSVCIGTLILHRVLKCRKQKQETYYEEQID